MNRTAVVLSLTSLIVACRREPPLAHMVNVVEGGGALMVAGHFGVPLAASTMNPLGVRTGVGVGRCLRTPSARQLQSAVDFRHHRPTMAARFRDAGRLIVRDEADRELSTLNAGPMGFYMGIVPRGAARRLSVEVTGARDVPRHRFDSIPLNPAGNPPRITAPRSGFTARRGANLRFTWAGAGYRDAFLTVMVGAESDARAIMCRLDFGRGAITLSGTDLDLPGRRGRVLLSASLITMTSSLEGRWLLNAMSSGASVTGYLQ